MNNFTEKTLLYLGNKLGLVPVKRFVTKTTTYGYDHFAILFMKTSLDSDNIDLPIIKSNGIFVNEITESFDESEWGKSWPYVVGDYFKSVKKFYRRVQKKETEPNPQVPFANDKLTFIVPHINDIVKIYTPLSKVDFVDSKNKTLLIR